MVHPCPPKLNFKHILITWILQGPLKLSVMRNMQILFSTNFLCYGTNSWISVCKLTRWKYLTVYEDLFKLVKTLIKTSYPKICFNAFFLNAFNFTQLCLATKCLVATKLFLHKSYCHSPTQPQLKLGVTK